MSRIGLTKDIILESAMEIVDSTGAEKLTLKTLADKLEVRSPSLYNHFNNLSDILSSLILYGWKQLENTIIKAAIGKSKDDAIKSMCAAYLDFSIAHIGLSEIMQSYNQHKSKEAEDVTRGLIATMRQVLSAYNLSIDKEVHIIRVFRSFLQGYVYLVQHDSFGTVVSIKDSFNVGVDMFLKGLEMLEKQSKEK